MRRLHGSAARHAGTGAVLTAWQATPSINSGASLRHRSNASGQRGLKAHPGGGLIGFGISPFTGMRWRPLMARSGTAPSSILGVGHARTGEQLASFRDLDDAAEIHHADAARHVADHGEVVADEHVGQAELVLEVAHQVQDLRLHGDVERGGRLVADDELRVGGERASDRDALTLAAREFVRKFQPVVGMQADKAGGVRRPAPGCRARPAIRSKARIGSEMMASTRKRGFRLERTLDRNGMGSREERN